MKDLLDYIVRNLVSKPDAIYIDEQSGNGEVSLTLTVDPSDMGLIIGKGGQTIHAIRKILTIRAIAENVRVNLQLNEPETQANTSEASAVSSAESVEEEPTESVDTSEVNKAEDEPINEPNTKVSA